MALTFCMAHSSLSLVSSWSSARWISNLQKGFVENCPCFSGMAHLVRVLYFFGLWYETLSYVWQVHAVSGMQSIRCICHIWNLFMTENKRVIALWINYWKTQSTKVCVHVLHGPFCGTVWTCTGSFDSIEAFVCVFCSSPPFFESLPLPLLHGSSDMMQSTTFKSVKMMNEKNWH